MSGNATKETPSPSWRWNAGRSWRWHRAWSLDDPPVPPPEPAVSWQQRAGCFVRSVRRRDKRDTIPIKTRQKRHRPHQDSETAVLQRHANARGRRWGSRRAVASTAGDSEAQVGECCGGVPCRIRPYAVSRETRPSIAESARVRVLHGSMSVGAPGREYEREERGSGRYWAVARCSWAQAVASWNSAWTRLPSAVVIAVCASASSIWLPRPWP